MRKKRKSGKVKKRKYLTTVRRNVKERRCGNRVSPNKPVLMLPDHSKPFQIESDAFKVATGAVLTQLDGNGDRHPCAFLSKTLSPTERNYEIYDREILGII